MTALSVEGALNATPDLAAEFATLAEASRKWDADMAKLSADHRAAYAKFGIYSK